MTDNLAERYAPTVTERHTIANGRTITYLHEDYGTAHALRQADAQAALDDITNLDGAVTLNIKCRDRIVARVYRTTRSDDLDLIIAVTPPGASITPDLHRINQETGRSGDQRITFSGALVVDPLRAPADRELEHSCKCNAVHELDRRMILERIAMGQRTATVGEIATH
jgi:hypothetical protein